MNDQIDARDEQAPLDVEDVLKKLKLFRIAAFVVGVGLLILVAEMVLKYGFDNGVLDWWAIPHGFLYMGYVGVTAALGFAARWSLVKMVLVMLAGCVPLLSFWVERKIEAQQKAELAAQRAG